MDITQALNMLLQAAQLAPLPAQTHQQCVEAFKVLQEAIKPVVEKPAKK